MLRIGDKNVLFGGKAITIISFRVDGLPYQAEEGMTWEEWCNTEYNRPDGDGLSLFCKDPYVGKYNGKRQFLKVILPNGTSISCSDLIIADTEYEIVWDQTIS